MTASAWHEFCETTTIQGVSDIYRARTKLSRITWLFIFITMCGVSVWAIWQVLDSYINSPISTSIATLNNASLVIPEFALCYTGAINGTKLQAAGLNSMTVKSLYQLFQYGGLESTSVLRTKLQPNLETIYQQQRSDLDAFMQRMNFSNIDDLLNYAAFTCDEIIDLMQSQSGTNCLNTTRIIHQNFGVCHVFPSTIQNWPATVAGWQLLLKAPKEAAFLSDVQFIKGFALEFGLPYTTITYDTHLVPVGKSVTVGLFPTFVKKLVNRPWPVSRKDDLCNATLNGRSASYCTHHCYVEEHLKACQCGPIGMKALVNSSEEGCLPGDHLSECFGRINWTKLGQCQQECKPPCEEWKFDVKLTFNDLSSEKLMLQQNFPTEIELRYILIEESDSYGLDNAISNIGGMFGLWLGASIFTVVHAVGFIVALLWEKVAVLYDKKRSPKIVNVATMPPRLVSQKPNYVRPDRDYM